jgi:hypothetical protein
MSLRLGFVLAVGRLAGVWSISVGDDGQSVDFIVRVHGSWIDAIGEIEPAVQAMRLNGGLFDYSVFESRWRHPDPPGYRLIFQARA